MDGKGTCDVCGYWEFIKFENVPAEKWGPCHRYPPKIRGNSKSANDTHFPLTLGDDWCGEFKQATEAQMKARKEREEEEAKSSPFAPKSSERGW